MRAGAGAAGRGVAVRWRRAGQRACLAALPVCPSIFFFPSCCLGVGQRACLSSPASAPFHLFFPSTIFGWPACLPRSPSCAPYHLFYPSSYLGCGERACLTALPVHPTISVNSMLSTSLDVTWPLQVCSTWIGCIRSSVKGNSAVSTHIWSAAWRQGLRMHGRAVALQRLADLQRALRRRHRHPHRAVLRFLAKSQLQRRGLRPCWASPAAPQLPPPAPVEAACNTAACALHVWSAGAWGPCPGTCAGARCAACQSVLL